jgi:hypothetical protein
MIVGLAVLAGALTIGLGSASAVKFGEPDGNGHP